MGAGVALTCQPSQYIMGLLIASTLYDKINLRTRFVAGINRGVDLDLLGCQGYVRKSLFCKNARTKKVEVECTGASHKTEEPHEHLIINCQ